MLVHPVHGRDLPPLTWCRTMPTHVGSCHFVRPPESATRCGYRIYARTGFAPFAAGNPGTVPAELAVYLVIADGPGAWRMRQDS
jgi:hypothetical protein